MAINDAQVACAFSGADLEFYPTQEFSLSFFMDENRRPQASSGLLC
jgi:hypothetical protein